MKNEGSLTIETHWDCECQNNPDIPFNHIHPKSRCICGICGAKREEQPDSRKAEVEAMYERGEYCGCDAEVRYFITKERSTFYWCGDCIDYETVDIVLGQIRPSFEIGEYDGPPISCVNGELMTPDTKEPEPPFTKEIAQEIAEDHIHTSITEAMHNSALEALERLESWFQEFAHPQLAAEECTEQMQNLDTIKDWMDASNPEEKKSYCETPEECTEIFIGNCQGCPHGDNEIEKRRTKPMNCKEYDTTKEDCRECEKEHNDEQRISLACYEPWQLDHMVGLKISTRRELAHIEVPEVPTIEKSYNSYEEAMEAKGRMDTYEKLKSELYVKKANLETQLKKNHEDIIDLIPFKNVWIKVKFEDCAYGVGFYRCDHGGDHSVIDIMQWSEEMPELKDRQSS